MKTSELLAYSPHRPPMVWVDEVVSHSQEGGVCRVHFNPKALYCTEGGIRPSAFIEFVAQSFMFCRSATAKVAGVAPPKGLKVFLAGISQAVWEPGALIPSATYDVEVAAVKIIGPLTVVEGKVKDARSASVFCVQLKLFSTD